MGVSSASAQDFFRVMGGIPHLPAVDPASVAAPVQGMLIFSKADKQPLVYNGTSWETLCSSNIVTTTVKDYLEVKTGIPFLPSLNEEPEGDISSGGIYFSKTDHTIKVRDSGKWNSVNNLFGKGDFTQNTGFSTSSALRISKLPVLIADPSPIGLSAGAVYINTISKTIRYYDGKIWVDINCLAIISTVPLSAITNVSARSGANIISNGGSAVTVEGICWSTSRYPDITLNTKTTHEVFGTDTGLFPDVISGLKASTVYYVRAYAINGAGVVYGDEITFTSAQASLPSVITLDIDNFTPISANSGGTISSDGGAPVTARGISWSSIGDPVNDPNATSTSDGSGVGTFPSRITGLLRNTVYYVRAYAVNVIGKAFGNFFEFKTPPATAPVLSSPNIKIMDITDISAVSEVTIINNGGELVTERGMSWSTDRVNITYGPSTTVNVTDIGTFICELNNLQPNTIYYVRAYAKNSVGISYSSESSFITTSFPTLTTLKPYNYDVASQVDGFIPSYNGTVALSGGDITSNGVSPIIKRGIVWGTSPNPTTDLTTKTETNSTGTGTGIFKNYLTALTPNTTYYIRAYAMNSMGTGYGEEMTLTTPALPEVTTIHPDLVTSTSFSSGGIVTSDGRVTVISRGICWGLTEDDLTTSGDHTVDGNGTGNYISAVKRLLGDTKYYIRAYAVNYVGTNYGLVDTLRTAPPELPAVITIDVPGTAGTTALATGEVLENGGALVSESGILWSSAPGFTPDLSSPLKVSGTVGIGRFNGTITGLAPNKTYYVKAYALNKVGVAYGNEVLLKTFTIPSLITTEASQVNSVSAVSGGDIFSDGGDPVTASGIVWSAARNPTVGLPTKTIKGAGIGSFIHGISGLLGNTTYYIRAYAQNTAGTAYGNEVSLITGPPVLASVSTAEAMEVTGNSAISGGRITSNGGAPISTSGIVWSTVAGFTPDTATTQKTVQKIPGSFDSQLSKLTPGTIYYVRAYAINSAGLVFGNEIVFKTATLPTLTTLPPVPGSVTSTSATSGGIIISNGGNFISRNGIAWGTAPDPTLANEFLVSGSGSGNFIAGLKDLLGSTQYYVRAFAENFAGIAYGNLVSLITNPPVKPELITTSATGITGKTAVSGGEIINNGGALVTTRGVIWSTNPDFDPAAEFINRTAETGYVKGRFLSYPKDLNQGTTYYLRAYAVNSAGTAYGEVISFTTPAMAVVGTNPPGLITNTTGIAGGTVKADGGATVTQKGIYWSTVENFEPANADKIMVEENGLGSFETKLKNLKPDTKYYIRAYAVTLAGVSFGEQLSFTTFPPALPLVATAQAKDVAGKTASGGVNILDENGAPILTKGVVWSLQSGFDPEKVTLNRTAQTGAGTGLFASPITGLTLGTTYYFRAYATNKVGTVYGNEWSFTTQNMGTLTTVNITANKESSARSGGVVISDGGAAAIEQGVCWSTSPNPTRGLLTKTFDAGNGVFNSLLTGLTPSTVYYVRAFLTNSQGTAYGNEISFNSSAILPTVITADPVITSNTTASTGGTVKTDGGAPVTARGVVWSKKTNFKPATEAAGRTVDGSGVGNFISNLDEVQHSTTYYIRAYATNSIGTVYGNQLTLAIFATSPVLTTNKATEITGTSGRSGGVITSDGGAPVTQRGIVWSTNQNPTIALATRTSVADAGDGTFTSQMTGLTPNTVYYVRSYAINGIGVAYGLEQTFITLAVPTLTATTPATDIRATTATSGGQITDNGRTPILSRGIVWDIRSNPTIALATKTVDNVTREIGSFTAGLSGLLPNTTYYIRAYATNSVGVNYGSETILKTNAVTLPVLTTIAATEILSTAVTSGGEITDDGGSPVTVKGVVWGTEKDPTILLTTKTANGSGKDPFVSKLSPLAIATSYFYRAYATNSVGTGYGNLRTVTTGGVLPVVSIAKVSDMTLNSANASAEVTFDGGQPVTARGFVWNTTGNPSLESGTVITNGTGAGSFSNTLNELNEIPVYYIRAYVTTSVGTAYSAAVTTFKICLPTFTVVHIAGANGAPVTKTVTYNSVSTNISGAARCWITQDLGADKPAGSAADNSAAATGWYWQFNRLQGYQPNGTARTPATAWTAVSDNNDWLPANDPCVQLIGSGWRMPGLTELSNVYSAGQGITNGDKAFASDLKLHMGGYLETSVGQLSFIGSQGNYWSSTSGSATSSLFVYFSATGIASVQVNKTYAFPVRCLRDVAVKAAPSVNKVVVSGITGNSAEVTAAATPDGGAVITDKGFVWNTTGNPTFADHKVSSGTAGAGSFTITLGNFVDGPTYYIRAYATNEIGTTYSAEVTTFKVCLPSFTVQHVGGLNGAPVTKTVIYNSVSTNLSGDARCWITQNLGADNPAASASDKSSAAGGWYWQFNRLQGYQPNGTVRTPATTWTGVSENSDWTAANDPCVQLIGSGWRMPTATEWNNVYSAAGITNAGKAYANELKLHMTGYLDNKTGAAVSQGVQGNYWSVNSTASTASFFVYFSATGILSQNVDKTFALPVRCLRDELVRSAPLVSKVTLVTLTENSADVAATVSADGSAGVTDAGFVWNTTGNPTLADRKISSSASGLGNFTNTLNNLTEVSTYYVRAYAVNNTGTNYSTETVSFKICPPAFTVTHTAGVNGAPVTKTVTYKAVNTDISGDSRCWITQDLGADNEATAATDKSDGSVGWYWQFNKIQGYKYQDPSTRIPSAAWTANVDNVNWLTANDPCNLLLGNGWRLPTGTEWTNAIKQDWSTLAKAYASPLKLHAAGYLNTVGGRDYFGSQSVYWSSSQQTANTGIYTIFNGGAAFLMTSNSKVYGFNVRCIRDALVITNPVTK